VDGRASREGGAVVHVRSAFPNGRLSLLAPGSALSSGRSLMFVTLRSITVDCADPYRLALWWCEVFGVSPNPDDHPGDPEAICQPAAGTRLLFERVPEHKSGKNRLHIDLHARSHGDEEIERLIQLGAGFLADHRRSDGGGWVVLSDPEGNEFCVERGIASA